MAEGLKGGLPLSVRPERVWSTMAELSESARRTRTGPPSPLGLEVPLPATVDIIPDGREEPLAIGAAAQTACALGDHAQTPGDHRVCTATP